MLVPVKPAAFVIALFFRDTSSSPAKERTSRPSGVDPQTNLARGSSCNTACVCCRIRNLRRATRRRPVIPRCTSHCPCAGGPSPFGVFPPYRRQYVFQLRDTRARMARPSGPASSPPPAISAAPASRRRRPTQSSVHDARVHALRNRFDLWQLWHGRPHSDSHLFEGRKVHASVCALGSIGLNLGVLRVSLDVRPSLAQAPSHLQCAAIAWRWIRALFPDRKTREACKPNRRQQSPRCPVGR